MEKMTAKGYFDYVFDLEKDEVLDMFDKKTCKAQGIASKIDGIKTKIEEEEVGKITTCVLNDLDDEDWEDDDFMDEIREEYGRALGGTILDELKEQCIVPNN